MEVNPYAVPQSRVDDVAFDGSIGKHMRNAVACMAFSLRIVSD